MLDDTYNSTIRSYSADVRQASSSSGIDDKSIKLQSLLLRTKELEEEIHAQDEEQSTKELEDELARTQAKMKVLQEDIDSMTKEGILNKEASITLAMITARVGLMFVTSPFSGFGVGVDVICILYVMCQLYRIASNSV